MQQRKAPLAYYGCKQHSAVLHQKGRGEKEARGMIRITEERGLKISSKKTEYLGCNEHQDVEIHSQEERVKGAKTFNHLESAMADDGGPCRQMSHTGCTVGGKTKRGCMSGEKLT